MKKTMLRYLSIAFLFIFLAGCRDPRDMKTPGKILVVTTTGMIADAVKNIAGDKVDVVALMGPGVDPHLYKATHGDLEKITAADIIFYNGLHLEGKMGSVLEKAERIRRVVPVTAGIDAAFLRAIPGYDAHDPHIWFDVALWRKAVENISAQLIKVDSVNTETYRVNTQRYLKALDSLNTSIERELSTIPSQQRVLITAHDAFGYFGDAYNIEVRGLQGISTLSEFGLRDVTSLVDFIIERRIKAIFVETSVSTKSINAILAGCREKGWNVRIGGNLYSDAMGDEGTVEGTYIGMVNANVKTIVSALK